jgi:hypothetical protein
MTSVKSGRLRQRGRIILKWILEKQRFKVGTGFFQGGV